MDSNEVETIYEAALACSETFGRVANMGHPKSASLAFVRELRGRFNIWTAYAGVFASPRARLDARLHSNPRIKGIVLELAEMIQNNLQWGNNISQTIKASLSNPSAVLSADDEGLVHHESPLSERDEVVEVEDSHNPGSASGQDVGLKEVEEAIERLLAMTATIRRSGRQHHNLRQGADDRSAVMLWSRYIHTRYSNARESGDVDTRESLYKQIAVSIHIRGSSLAYLRNHNQKLATKYEERFVHDKPLSDGQHPQPMDYSTAYSGSVKSGSRVEKSLRSNLQGGGVTPGSSRGSRRSGAPSSSIVSRGHTVANDKFDYPPKPKGRDGETDVACPLCNYPLKLPTLTDEHWK